MKKVGLFFGSFNPIHIGHVILASYVVDHSDLDQIWFVVSPQNPFKEKSSLLAFHHRYAMVQATVEDDARLRACDIESKLDQPSYTVNTLVVLSEKHPEIQFTLIMGGDNLASFHKWKNYEAILQNYSILCYSRPESGKAELANHLKVTVLDAPQMDYSSSLLRNMIKEGKTVQYLMPPKAWAYLDEMNLYKA
jgi:nicotinate-nucleotide adenylyltransferase